MLSILSIYSESSSLLNEMDMSADVLRIITGAAVQHEKTQIVEASILTIGKILIVDDSLTEATRLQLVGILAGAVLPAQDAEVRRNAIVIIKNISKNKYEVNVSVCIVLTDHLMLLNYY